MVQACKNIMSVTKDVVSGEEIQDMDFFLDNLRMNYTIILELFMQIPPEKNTFITPEALRRSIDFVNTELARENLTRIIFHTKNAVPTLKEKLERELKTI
jgi:hypothetical protein